MKKFLVMLGASFVVLTGCNQTASTTTCTDDQGETGSTVVTLDAKGDTVEKMTQVSNVSLTALGTDEAAITPQLEVYKEKYDITGVTYAYEFKDTNVVETIVMDFTTVDLEEATTLGLLPETAENQDAKTISLEASKKNFESDSFVCK